MRCAARPTEGSVANVTGLEVIKGSQINTAVTAGFNGENGTGTDIGFAVIEADSLEEAVGLVSQTPCAVAQGVVEVWPLLPGEE